MINPVVLDKVILAVPLLHVGLLAIITPVCNPSVAPPIFLVVSSFV